MTTTSRLLHLLSLLQTRRDWPGEVLAGRLEVSHRTIRRDVDRLREMGYRISAVKGPDGGYRLDAGSELPPLLFDDDQAVALAVALQTAAASGAGIEEAALRALTTVRQVLPSRLRHRLDALEFTAIPAGRTAPVAPDVLLALSSAVHAKEVLRFDYPAGQPDTPDTPAPVRRVEPHHLVTVRGRWYLVGWDLERGDWRIFRADRMHPRTPAGPRFTPRELPGGDVRQFVAARFKGSDQADAWPCSGSVVLSLPAVQVLPFAGDGVVEDLGTGQCRLTAGSWSWVSLAASFGRFDADIQVISPPQLAAAFGTLASRFAAAAADATR
ncbi:WYL domain-containing protein [Arthrobacter sp. Sa2BUA2]|uniref:WYL domain-containing protein n=1 Tax=Arthrobacter pullicola TaxID=2762224 RepID=A0ABR8YHN4_9MICC|nr:WYL domain-containing protein [Arthrobacter pullicola]MBD8043479.1 WYL domain-containing protein [Arthrobacter pullicola]